MNPRTRLRPLSTPSILLLAVAVAALALAAPGRVSAEDRVSPDGSLAARVASGPGGGETLAVVARAGGAEVAAWRSPGLIEAAWAPDSRGLALFDHRASGSIALLFAVAPATSGEPPALRLLATSLAASPAAATTDPSGGNGTSIRWVSATWNAENRQVSLRGLGADNASARTTLALESEPVVCLKGVPGVEPATFGWGSVVAEGSECPASPASSAASPPADPTATPKSCCTEKDEAGKDKACCASKDAASAAEPKACCADKPATPDATSAPTEPAPTAAAPEADPAIGRWEGQWFFKVGQRLVPGGKMGCMVERTGPEAWKATFEAEWGKTKDREAQAGIWKVSLDGKREDGKIVFGGDVDLGAASGGVFNWNGSIVGDAFDGEYRSKMVNGSFQMKRAVEGAEAEAEPAAEAAPATDAPPAEGDAKLAP